MNFTREPILETIISAKEGYKLQLKSTKNDGKMEYLVDAVEVVCFGTTFFYRSCELAHTFFVPAQDFEIVQVRQTRLVLKTPTEKNIKIAGGDQSKNDNKKDNKKSKSKSKDKKAEDKKAEDKKDEKKSDDKKVEGKKDEPKKGDKKEEAKKGEKKSDDKKVDAKKDVTEKTQEEKSSKEKNDEKPKKEAKGKNKKAQEKKQPKAGKEDLEDVPPAGSIFSHLLRPPESLISDSIHKYQAMQEEGAKEKEINVTKEVEIHHEVEVSDNPIDDPNLTSESPKPFEKLTEQEEEEKPMSLKEKVKQVLSPSIKNAMDEDGDAGK